MSQQPSGWYDDPSNPEMLRYWDGVTWTNHTAPKKSPTLSQPTATIPQAPSAPQAPQQTTPMPQGGGWQGQNVPQQTQYPGQYPQYPQAPGWLAAGPTTIDGVPLASWGKRLGAWILDGIIISIVGGLIGRAVAPGYFDSISNLVDAASRGASPSEINAISNQLTGSAIEFSFVVWLVASAYCILFWTTTAQTPGKMALGISVRSVDRPGPLGMGTAVARRVVPLAAMVVPFLTLLDGLWPLWDAKRQALHDKVAKTQVVVGKQPRRQA